jgi:hypothetical protein
MKKTLILTLVISVLLGIALPLVLGVKDPLYISISFSSVWAIYSLILLGYVFLVEGRRDRNILNPKKEDDPFPPELIQKWEALWEITVKRCKDPRIGKADWN